LDLEIRYQPGKANQAADALSCQKALVQAKDGDSIVCQLAVSCEEDTPGGSLAPRQDMNDELNVIKQYLLTRQLSAEDNLGQGTGSEQVPV